MLIYAFEKLGSDLELMPLAARRAADHAGLKPSLISWQSLKGEARRALVQAGSASTVDVACVTQVLADARPAPAVIAALADPPGDTAPLELIQALGADQALTPAVWSALSGLERYVLVKLAIRQDSQRLAAAYAEIVGQSAELTHLDAAGSARMVGISEKRASARRALATSRVCMNSDAFARLERGNAPKGDVLGTARLAGIMAAKRTSDLIPLCHPIALTRVDVRLELDPSAHAVDVSVAVEAFDRTGVEMEALTAASAAALTVYDMLKAFDRGMLIGPTRLQEKSGGRSGDYARTPTSDPPAEERFAIREAPLSVEEALRLVARPAAGGSVAFVGSVRDQNAGQPVSLLEYQAYSEMAVQELRRIGQEIEEELTGVRVAALHRSGELRVGDVAVVCAASAAHREEAFRAARWLIDRIKERVPIWKREHGPDGPYWVGWHDARGSAP